MPRSRHYSRRIAFVLAVLSAGGLAACASGTGGARDGNIIRLSDRARVREVMDSLQEQAVERQLAADGREGGPRVSIYSDGEFGSVDRVTTRFRLDDDGYVAVFNVDRDGRVRTLYPEDPADAGFLRGGYTYKLPSFFPGFGSRGFSSYAPGFGGSGYSLARYGAGTVASRTYDRQGGYVFVVASWSPLRLDRLEEEDLWDTYQVAERLGDLSPYRLMREYADLLVPRGRSWYTVDYRYYHGGWGGTFASSRCDIEQLSALGLGRFAAFTGRLGYADLMGLYNDLALGGCRDAASLMYRAIFAAMLNGQTSTGIVRPTLPVGLPTTTPTTGTVGTGSTGSQPAPSDHPKADDGKGTRKADDDEGKSTLRPPTKTRGEAEDGDEIDLGTRERRPARARWDTPRAAGSRSTDGWGRYTGRSPGDADGGRRAANRSSDETRDARPRERARPERSETRSSEPRTERPRSEPRPEPPRSEPRSEPRAEPVRSEPISAPAPAPRPEAPRSEPRPRDP
jgi:hypothetical protein